MNVTEIKDKVIRCPYCGGDGTWECECCNGSGGCSCQGQPVPMGMCHVCKGTGSVVEGQYDMTANRFMVEGLCYLGDGGKYPVGGRSACGNYV